jgi:hypothetical protein
MKQNTFKSIALKVLEEAGKPLHAKEITKIAIQHGWLETVGKTPHETMNSQLIVDVNAKGDSSVFRKVGPSTYGLNPKMKSKAKIELEKNDYPISKHVSSKQKGDITEGRIAELISLYGDTTLSCYKPISDDEGIDLIVKKKGELKAMYIQVKSRYSEDPTGSFVAQVKASGMIDHYSMGVVFCLFDTTEGDLHDYLWFVPAPDFMKLATLYKEKGLLRFVAGMRKNNSNKWDEYLIEKRGLANAIIKQLDRF